MMTTEEMDEILRDLAEANARRLADMPGGGMIAPNEKFDEYFDLTDEEEAALCEAGVRDEFDNGSIKP